MKAKNLEAKTDNKEKVETIASNLKDSSVYNTGLAKNENAPLLGF